MEWCQYSIYVMLWYHSAQDWPNSGYLWFTQRLSKSLGVLLNPQLKSGEFSLFQIFYIPICVTEIFKLSLTLEILPVNGILGRRQTGLEILAPLGHTKNSVLSHCNTNVEMHQCVENVSLTKCQSAICHWPNPTMQLVWIMENKKENRWHHQLKSLRKVTSWKDSFDDRAQGQESDCCCSKGSGCNSGYPKAWD